MGDRFLLIQALGFGVAALGPALWLVVARRRRGRDPAGGAWLASLAALPLLWSLAPMILLGFPRWPQESWKWMHYLGPASGLLALAPIAWGRPRRRLLAVVLFSAAAALALVPAWQPEVWLWRAGFAALVFAGSAGLAALERHAGLSATPLALAVSLLAGAPLMLLASQATFAIFAGALGLSAAVTALALVRAPSPGEPTPLGLAAELLVSGLAFSAYANNTSETPLASFALFAAAPHAASLALALVGRRSSLRSRSLLIAGVAASSVAVAIALALARGATFE